MATLHLPHFEREEHPRLGTALHLFWGACAAIVLLFIFFAALGAIDPADAVVVTAVVLALALLWLTHAWRGLWRDERRMR
jgi:cobalamin biosynthesis protein CobD/CbiB